MSKIFNVPFPYGSCIAFSESGIKIEKKNEMPKRCGHFIGKKWDFLTFFL